VCNSYKVICEVKSQKSHWWEEESNLNSLSRFDNVWDLFDLLDFGHDVKTLKLYYELSFLFIQEQTTLH